MSPDRLVHYENYPFDRESLPHTQREIVALLSRTAIGLHPLPEADKIAVGSPYYELKTCIEERLLERKSPRHMQGYIASGSQAHVYRTGDGNVIKIPLMITGEGKRDILERYAGRRGYLTALERAKGIPGLEQVVGYIENDPITIVCKEIEGQTLEDMDHLQREAIPKEHFKALMNVLKIVEDRGLQLLIDYHDSNLMYNEQTGFTIIDFNVSGGHHDLRADKVAAAIGGDQVLLADYYGASPDHRDPAKTGGCTNFYRAYRETFGESATTDLQSRWRKAGIVLDCYSD